MLKVQGREVKDVNENLLKKVFGESWCWTSEFYTYIQGRIKSGGDISIRQLLEDFLSTRRPGGYLTNLEGHLHSDYNKMYIITMTGDRGRDSKEAKTKARCTSSIKHYRWHHCERIWATMSGINCKMCLVEEDYHKTSHNGGVDEYHLVIANGYRSGAYEELE